MTDTLKTRKRKSKSCEPLDDELIQALRVEIEDKGENYTRNAIGLSRMSFLRCMAGLTVNLGTRTLVMKYLTEETERLFEMAKAK